MSALATTTQLVGAIDQLLPQTQCTRCGYPDCRAYAQAIARKEADINQCPPGGQAGVQRLALLLGVEEKPLSPAYGHETPRAAAMIDESGCIGCTLCIQACPVDAIVGAAKRMHAVLTAYCTGCELCVPPCPVDCIDMVDLAILVRRGNPGGTALLAQTSEERAQTARQRYGFHQFRTARESSERAQRLAVKAESKLAALERQPSTPELDRKKETIAAALERARSRRAEADRTQRKPS